MSLVSDAPCSELAMRAAEFSARNHLRASKRCCLCKDVKFLRREGLIFSAHHAASCDEAGSEGAALKIASNSSAVGKGFMRDTFRIIVQKRTARPCWGRENTTTFGHAFQVDRATAQGAFA